MELTNTDPALAIWQILIIIISILLVTSWYIILTSKRIDSKDRLSWLLGTFLLPVIGPLIFLFRYQKKK